jgi:integrase
MALRSRVPVLCGPLQSEHAILAESARSAAAYRRVSERLGHATVSITLDTYSHAIPAMQEEAAVLIAGLVFAGR